MKRVAALPQHNPPPVTPADRGRAPLSPLGVARLPLFRQAVIRVRSAAPAAGRKLGGERPMAVAGARRRFFFENGKPAVWLEAK